MQVRQHSGLVAAKEDGKSTTATLDRLANRKVIAWMPLELCYSFFSHSTSIYMQAKHHCA
jgi:hypothetical protein